MNVQKSGRSAQEPIWEEPVRGFYTDPGQFVTLSGLDLLRTMLDGGLGPPIRYLFGLAPTAAEPGGVTFTMPVTDWLLFPQGVISGATLAILVDAPLGCTVQTALRADPQPQVRGRGATGGHAASLLCSGTGRPMPREGALTAVALNE